MENQVNLTTATDLELAGYINAYHGKLREAEQGLASIAKEIANRNLKVNKAAEGE